MKYFRTRVDTEQALEEEIHLIMRVHLIVQTEEFLDYTMTETMKEHRSLPFASNMETSQEPRVHFQLLQERAKLITVLKHVQQGKLF